MDRARLMAMVETLGQTFAARGMKRHVEELRVYWLGLAKGLVPPGRKVNVGWSESLVVEWFRVLRLPPHQWDYTVRRPSSARSTHWTSGLPVSNAIAKYSSDSAPN